MYSFTGLSIVWFLYLLASLRNFHIRQIKCNYGEIADQIFALREKRLQASMDTVQRDEQLQRITELQDFIKDQSSDLTVFDETLEKRWLKQIVIWPTHCTVELKYRLKVDVER